ncbi:PDR/VanB family oxidoreductase [Motiliproteus sediminis]|uniref:PDR/VanB family oxidoreductase n=1 Tax=Motiliproteus sediminis TaxID=1468178 RepID=UPI001AEFC7FD|nr:PDR/VanB family oxidoreductase [Motiliproteus sediminis]
MNDALIPVRVADKYPIATDTVALELVAADGGELPPFTAGAHIDVQIGYGISRQYSLANDPAETHRYLLGVLKAPNSRGGSAMLHDLVMPGFQLNISPPRNLFPLREDAPFSLLIGGGIGITPMLTFAYRLQQLGKPFELHLHARSRERAPFLELLTSAPFANKVYLHLDDDPEGGVDYRALLAGNAATEVYLCGPNGFMEAIGSALQGAIVPEQLHREVFDAAEPAAVNQPFDVQLASSGDVLTVPADQTLVEALQLHGVPISRNCPRGFCGGCAVTVLEGEVDHRDNVLPQELRDAGRMLSCVSRAKSGRLLLEL